MIVFDPRIQQVIEQSYQLENQQRKNYMVPSQAGIRLTIAQLAFLCKALGFGAKYNLDANNNELTIYWLSWKRGM